MRILGSDGESAGGNGRAGTLMVTQFFLCVCDPHVVEGVIKGNCFKYLVYDFYSKRLRDNCHDQIIIFCIIAEKT